MLSIEQVQTFRGQSYVLQGVTLQVPDGACTTLLGRNGMGKGGGYLPLYPYRMDHAWEVRPESRKQVPHPPSTYLAKLYFDTVVFDPRQLANLVQWAGDDHVLLGTDYPYDMGETDPVGLVSRVPGLDPAGRERIMGGNAVRLLELAGTPSRTGSPAGG